MINLMRVSIVIWKLCRTFLSMLVVIGFLQLSGVASVSATDRLASVATMTAVSHCVVVEGSPDKIWRTGGAWESVAPIASAGDKSDTLMLASNDECGSGSDCGENCICATKSKICICITREPGTATRPEAPGTNRQADEGLW